MSSNDPFFKLQHKIRQTRDMHGVDISVPNGVEVDGKKYPAINKLFSETTYRTGLYNHQGSFDIPLENGLRAKIILPGDQGQAIYGTTDLPLLQKEFPVMRIGSLHVPTIYSNNHKGYHPKGGQNVMFINQLFHPPMSSKDDHISSSTFHESIEKLANLPAMGQFTKLEHFTGPNDGDHRDLTPEELAEHRKEYKFKPENGPSFIKLHLFDVYSKRGQKDNPSKYYKYDTRTEQLHQIDGLNNDTLTWDAFF